MVKGDKQQFEWKLPDKLDNQPVAIDVCDLLLGRAMLAREKARPNRSGYKVGESALVAYLNPDGKTTRYEFVDGFNFEDSAPSAIQPNATHAEDCLRSNAANLLTPSDHYFEIDFLAIATESDPAPPCGDCRDALLASSSPDSYSPIMRPDSKVLAGSMKDGTVLLWDFSELTPRIFDNDAGKQSLNKYGEWEERALLVLGHERRGNELCAAVYTIGGAVLSGQAVPSASFYPVQAVGSAVSFAQRCGYADLAGAVFIVPPDAASLLPDGKAQVALPFGCYQTLVDAFDISLVDNPVVSVYCPEAGVAVRGPVERFLPHPFSLKTMGLDDVVKARRKEIMKRRS